MKVKLAYQDKTINVTAKSFGIKVAKVMNDLKSSNIYFVIQQAYGEIDWGEAEEILKAVIKEDKTLNE